MTRDGGYSWDCFDDERERFDAVTKKIIEELREPYAFVGRGEVKPVTYKSGDPRWFDRVLARRQVKGLSTPFSTRDSVSECFPP
jgi:hypothetical protein